MAAKNDDLDVDILKSKSEALSAEQEAKVKSPNTGSCICFCIAFIFIKIYSYDIYFLVIFQDEKEFVRITFRIPGLNTKRRLNLSRAPKNGRVIGVDYKTK